MCYNASYLEKKKAKLVERYKDALPSNQESQKDEFELPTYYLASGFDHPKMAIIKNEGIFLYEWGLIPNWAKDAGFQNNTINAKSETIFELDSFKNSIVSKRCILPVSGFFESKEVDKKKFPHFIHIDKIEIFSLACIYDSWLDRQTGEIRNTFSIITTQANAMMEKIHNVKKRMPVILQQTDEKKWLDPKLTKAEIIDLMKPYPKQDLSAYTVSREANNVKINRNKAEILQKAYFPELNTLQLFD